MLPLNVSGPVPEASIVPPLRPIEKSRSVVAAPRYCSVPPLRTRFEALLVDAPMPLFIPPLANDVVARIPAVDHGRTGIAVGVNPVHRPTPLLVRPIEVAPLSVICELIANRRWLPRCCQ